MTSHLAFLLTSLNRTPNIFRIQRPCSKQRRPGPSRSRIAIPSSPLRLTHPFLIASLVLIAEYTFHHIAKLLRCEFVAFEIAHESPVPIEYRRVKRMCPKTLVVPEVHSKQGRDSSHLVDGTSQEAPPRWV